MKIGTKINLRGNKYWSGLLRDYYGPRAAIYFKYLIESLAKGEDFNLKNWRIEWIKLTNEWQNARDAYPVKRVARISGHGLTEVRYRTLARLAEFWVQICALLRVTNVQWKFS